MPCCRLLYPLSSLSLTTRGVYTYQHGTRPCCRLLYQLSSLSLTTRRVYTYQHGTKPCCRLLHQLLSLSFTTRRVYTYQHGTKPCCRLLYQLLSLSLTLGGSTNSSMVLSHAVVFYISCYLSLTHLDNLSYSLDGSYILVRSTTRVPATQRIALTVERITCHTEDHLQ